MTKSPSQVHTRVLGWSWVFGNLGTVEMLQDSGNSRPQPERYNIGFRTLNLPPQVILASEVAPIYDSKGEAGCRHGHRDGHRSKRKTSVLPKRHARHCQAEGRHDGYQSEERHGQPGDRLLSAYGG